MIDTLCNPGNNPPNNNPQEPVEIKPQDDLDQKEYPSQTPSRCSTSLHSPPQSYPHFSLINMTNLPLTLPKPHPDLTPLPQCCPPNFDIGSMGKTVHY